jgi:hypothetical protein
LQLPRLWRDHVNKKGYIITEDQVHALHQCCPSLVQLEGSSVLSVMPALSSLVSLTRLCAVRGTKPQMAVLKKLTQLQEVSLVSSSARNCWEDYHLTPPQQLPRLTRLELLDGMMGGCQPLSGSAVESLCRFVNLVELSAPLLTEYQLSRLTSLTRLASLSFTLQGRGVLLVNRLTQLNATTSQGWSAFCIKVSHMARCSRSNSRGHFRPTVFCGNPCRLTLSAQLCRSRGLLTASWGSSAGNRPDRTVAHWGCLCVQLYISLWAQHTNCYMCTQQH